MLSETNVEFVAVVALFIWAIIVLAFYGALARMANAAEEAVRILSAMREDQHRAADEADRAARAATGEPPRRFR